MEINVQLPFQQLLNIIKKLSPAQKEMVKQELTKEDKPGKNDDEFINYLLSGPIYSAEEISVIEENRKSIAAWRTTN